MRDEFTEEQKKLLGRAKMIILPAFNDEWVIEVYSHDDELQGRFNAVDNQMLISAIQSAIDEDGPLHGPEVN